MNKLEKNMKKNKTKKIGLIDVKSALRDGRFREMLPSSYEKDINEFLNNPNCPCNLNLYRNVLKDCIEQLTRYFPGRDIEEVSENLINNNWSVINCNIDELESRLRKLPPGRKQLAVTRFEDLVTVVVNELDY